MKLCLLTQINSQSFAEYKNIILAAIRGGVTCIQLREKSLPYSELKSFALALQTLVKPFRIPLIINDNVKLAKEINADGVHLGQSDTSPLAARKILGKNKIIGLSIETLQELNIANQLTCIDYIAASAVFQSKSKTNCRTIWGLEGLKKVVNQSVHPVIAIGGINLSNIEKVMNTSVTGVAVIGAIHDHSCPEEITRNLLQKISSADKAGLPLPECFLRGKRSTTSVFLGGG